MDSNVSRYLWKVASIVVPYLVVGSFLFTVTAETNFEERRDANVAHSNEVLLLPNERQVAPGFVSPVHSHTVKFIVVLVCS